jgi:hypothetical protein
MTTCRIHGLIAAPMKTRAVALVLAMAPAYGAADFAGAWVACDPKTPWAYSLLSVDLEGKSYRWTAEWGSAYAAGGNVHLRSGELILRGCGSYRGEVAAGCDEQRPPVFQHLRRQDLDRTRGYFTAADLRRARWVRVAKGSSWQALAHECERVVDQMKTQRQRGGQ